MIRLNLLKSQQTPVPQRRAETVESPRVPREFLDSRTSRKNLWAWIVFPILIVLLIGAGLYLASRTLKHLSANPALTGNTDNAQAAPSSENNGRLAETSDTSAPNVSSDSLDYPPVDSMQEGSPEVTPAAAAPPPAPAMTSAPTSAPATAATPVSTPASPASPPSPVPDAGSVNTVNLAFQNFCSRRILQDLETASPAGVGFTRVMFTPPQAFSVSGVASTQGDLQHFQNSMSSLPGVALDPGQVRSAGAARVFTFSGQVQYPGAVASPNRALSGNQLSAALQRFLDLARAQNIDLPEPQLRDSTLTGGGARQFLYHVEANCDYVQLQGLLDKLQGGRPGIGIQRLELSARGQETMVVSLDLVAFVK